MLCAGFVVALFAFVSGVCLFPAGSLAGWFVLGSGGSGLGVVLWFWFVILVFVACCFVLRVVFASCVLGCLVWMWCDCHLWVLVFRWFGFWLFVLDCVD